MKKLSFLSLIVMLFSTLLNYNAEAQIGSLMKLAKEAKSGSPSTYQNAKKAKDGKFELFKENEKISNAHNDNIGKVVFANELIDFKTPDPAKWIQSVDMSQVLRFRAYFKESAHNTLANKINATSGKLKKSKKSLCARMKINYYLDNKEVLSVYYYGKTPKSFTVNVSFNTLERSYKEDGTFETSYTTFNGVLRDQEMTSVERDHFDKIIEEQKPSGIKDLKIEIVAFDALNEDDLSRQIVLATGSVKMNFDPKERPFIRKLCMPKPSTGNHSADVAVVKYLKDNNYLSLYFSMVYVGEGKGYGAEKERSVGAWVFEKHGEKCTVVILHFDQTYNPVKGEYNDNLVARRSENREVVNCKCLSK